MYMDLETVEKTVHELLFKILPLCILLGFIFSIVIAIICTYAPPSTSPSSSTTYAQYGAYSNYLRESNSNCNLVEVDCEHFTSYYSCSIILSCNKKLVNMRLNVKNLKEVENVKCELLNKEIVCYLNYPSIQVEEIK